VYSPAFKEALAFRRKPSTDCYEREAEDVIFPEVFGAKKSAIASLRPSLWRGKVKRSSSRTRLGLKPPRFGRPEWNG